ncbi:MAG TPA: T9SS type A sorting domain-containing protein [Flavobacteriales bacterium]|nr:T9SS type A sorting domain-containing protein [Flavobacteriales bacterium]
MEPFKITIAEPCRENWNNMSPTEQGRFCAVCDKSVVDFTQKSPAQIQSVLQYANGNVCGRFNSTDLNRTLVPETVSTPTRKLNTKWFAWISIFAFLGFSKKAGAIQQKITEKQKPGQNRMHAKQGHTLLHGTVKHSQTLKGIANVEIEVYSGGKKIAFTKTISTGAYWMNLPENSLLDFSFDISYNAVNFEGKMLEKIPAVKEVIKLDVLVNEIAQEQPLGIVHIEKTFMEVRAYEAKTAVKTNMVHSVMGGPTYQSVAYDAVRNHIDPVDEKTDSTFMRDEVVVPKNISIKTYPNPTAGFINIDVENAQQLSIQIFDLAGKLMHTSTSRETKNVVDMSSFPNGTYIVRVINDADNKVVQSRVVKVN